MAKENVIKFYEQLKADKASAEALKAALASAKPADKDAAAGTLIAFAKARGFEFSREDLAAAEAEATQELTTEELDKVAAGGFCWIIGGGWGAHEENGCVYACLGLGIGITAE